MTTFGRAPRDTVCDCEASTDPSLSQALHLLNGSTISAKVSRDNKVKNWMEKDGLTAEQVIERIYLRCVTRTPSKAEMDKLMKSVNEAENKVNALEDIFWAVLNSREFVFNH